LHQLPVSPLLKLPTEAPNTETKYQGATADPANTIAGKMPIVL